jgi:hypothetical protein
MFLELMRATWTADRWFRGLFSIAAVLHIMTITKGRKWDLNHQRQIVLSGTDHQAGVRSVLEAPVFTEITVVLSDIDLSFEYARLQDSWRSASGAFSVFRLPYTFTKQILFCIQFYLLFQSTQTIYESIQMTYLYWGRVSNAQHISTPNGSSSGAV